MNWLTYAIAAMILFSISNVFMKIAVSNFNVSTLSRDYLIRAAVAAVICIAVIYFLLINGTELGGELLKPLAIVAVLSVGAFIFFLAALRHGKVALVGALLSIGTVLTAILSVIFLNEKFALKEIVAMALAIITVFLLVI